MSDAYDAHPKRNLVPVQNVHKIDGIFLEDVPEIAPGYAPGYVVVYRDWPMDTFIMRKREGVSNEEIFAMVDILLAEKNIRPRTDHLD